MNILFACEESQIVLSAFYNKGHNVTSCDLLPCSGPYPQFHVQDDVRNLLQFRKYDILIGFPPCTYLSKCQLNLCTNDAERMSKQNDAVEFVKYLYNSHERVVLENPPGILTTKFMPYTQLVQPYMFGDVWRKELCLWVKGLPPLRVPSVSDWSDIRRPVSNRVNSSMTQFQKSIIKSRFFPHTALHMANTWG